MYRLLLLISCLSFYCSAAPESVLKWKIIKDALNSEEMNAEDAEDDILQLGQAWQEFKIKYGKQYDDDEIESARKEIFAKHLREIELHNILYIKGLKTYTLGINQFADLELPEFLEQFTGLDRHLDLSKVPESEFSFTPVDDEALPSFVNWTAKGLVTPVKDQGQCGSCWSFSATGALEGQHARDTGKLVSLSEQNLIDCSTYLGNDGCNGGWPYLAFTYVQQSGGIESEADYPYEHKNDKCRFNKSKESATCQGYVRLTRGSESALQQAVATIGPVSVCIDAGHSSFQLYKTGIYNEPLCSPTNLDHAVLAVGYGTTNNGHDYWIVKNSWATIWGSDGYILMSRNKNNQCGIATEATYPKDVKRNH